MTPEEEAEWARIKAQEAQEPRPLATHRETTAEAFGLQVSRAPMGSEEYSPELDPSEEEELTMTELLGPPLFFEDPEPDARAPIPHRGLTATPPVHWEIGEPSPEAVSEDSLFDGSEVGSSFSEESDSPESNSSESDDTVMEEAAMAKGSDDECDDDGDTLPGGMEEGVFTGSNLQSSCEPSLLTLPEIQQTAPMPFLGPFQPKADRTEEQARESVNALLDLAKRYPLAWEVLVGWYFQEGRNPGTYLGQGCEAQGPLWGVWEPNLLLQDRREHNPEMFPGPYLVPKGPEGDRLQSIAWDIMDGNEDLFSFAIRTWQSELIGNERNALENILFRAGWYCNVERCPEWYRVAMVKRMAPGPQKDAELRSVLQELPRFTKRCWEDPRCW